MAKFSGVLMEATATFGGRFPTIPIDEAMRAGVVDDMKDPDPMYITLPIGKVDSQSRNGRTYPRAAMEAMVEAINTYRPSGQLGHLRETDRPYSFSVGPLKWLGAVIEQDGTVWGKAYVLPFAEDVRQHIKVAKFARSPIGTSLYGMGETDDEDRVISLQVESIDLVDPSRVGVREAAVVPTITAETFDETRAADSGDVVKEDINKGKIDMATEVTLDTSKQAPAPATPSAAPVSETEQQRKHTEAVRLLNETITSLKHDLEDYKQIVTEMGNPDDPLIAFRLLQEKIRQSEEENGKLLQETMDTQVKTFVKVPTVQPIVLTMLKGKKPTTRAKVEQMLKEIVDSPEIKDLLQSQVVAESGPKHERPATPAADESAKSVFLGY